MTVLSIKTTKNPYGSRPVVSGSSGPTEGISDYVDSPLQPVVKLTSSYLCDSSAFVHHIEIQWYAHDVLLVTIDMSALHTSIPHQEGIQKVGRAAERHYRNAGLHTRQIFKCFLQYILKINVFTFAGYNYLQCHGPVNGSKNGHMLCQSLHGRSPSKSCLPFVDMSSASLGSSTEIFYPAQHSSENMLAREEDGEPYVKRLVRVCCALVNMCPSFCCSAGLEYSYNSTHLTHDST